MTPAIMQVRNVTASPMQHAHENEEHNQHCEEHLRCLPRVPRAHTFQIVGRPLNDVLDLLHYIGIARPFHSPLERYLCKSAEAAAEVAHLCAEIAIGEIRNALADFIDHIAVFV